MALLDEPPYDIGPLIALERARLLELLADLGPDDWDRPTACPAWSVLGLCCHLVGDDLGVLARGRDRHFGTPPPGGDEAGFIFWIDELQMEWVRAARRLSPRLVVDLLRWAGPQLVEHFSAQDLRSLSAHVSWALDSPVPIWFDQLRELSEYWIHRQQLLEALGRPEDLRADVAAPVLDGLRWAYPFRLSAVEAQAGDTVSLSVTGPVSTDWQLIRDVADWDFRTVRTSGTRPIAALRLTTSQAWRLLTNNLPPDRRSELDVSGRTDVVDVLVRTRAIIGEPT